MEAFGGESERMTGFFIHSATDLELSVTSLESGFSSKTVRSNLLKNTAGVTPGRPSPDSPCNADTYGQYYRINKYGKLPDRVLLLAPKLDAQHDLQPAPGGRTGRAPLHISPCRFLRRLSLHTTVAHVPFIA